MEQPLANRKILVVEDEYYLASDIGNELAVAGASVLGPVPSVEEAIWLIDAEESLDAAVLDINLEGERAYPVADALAARGIPFVFTTGYDRSALPTCYADAPRFEKPVHTEAVVRRIAEIIQV